MKQESSMMEHHFRNLHLRNADGSGRGEVRHVQAVVSKVFPDRYNHDGAEHQHIWIDQLQALDGGQDYASNVFVATRVTEGGIGHDIPFVEGNSVEMQGDWIPANQATAGEDDPHLPVLHFTHRPVGFVRWERNTRRASQAPETPASESERVMSWLALCDRSRTVGMAKYDQREIAG
jgi:hypothetical protein